MPLSRLWAVTSYFNPVGYRRKLPNYREFRKRLDVPLVAVAHSQDGSGELGPSDADILVKVRGGDVMWQKERLLNLAISHLPKECEYIAWIDCDVVFGRSDWAAAAMRELDRTPLCQLYRTVYHIGRDATSISRETSIKRNESFAHAVTSGLTAAVAATTSDTPGTFKRGHAWCARRDLVDAYGLYDRNIVGGGVKLLAHAVTDQIEAVIAQDRMTRAHADDYRRWAKNFRQAVPRLGCIDGDIFHLWHGDLVKRRYSARFHILNSSNYDPSTDIALDAEGCWKWNSMKPELHRLVREYFEQRDEDGEQPDVSRLSLVKS